MSVFLFGLYNKKCILLGVNGLHLQVITLKLLFNIFFPSGKQNTHSNFSTHLFYSVQNPGNFSCLECLCVDPGYIRLLLCNPCQQ